MIRPGVVIDVPLVAGDRESVRVALGYTGYGVTLSHMGRLGAYLDTVVLTAERARLVARALNYAADASDAHAHRHDAHPHSDEP